MLHKIQIVGTVYKPGSAVVVGMVVVGVVVVVVGTVVVDVVVV